MAGINDRNNPCVQAVIREQIIPDDELRAFLNQVDREGAAGPARPLSKKEAAIEGLYEVYVNGLLSSPKTQMINIVSNMYPVLTRPLETLTAATWSTIFQHAPTERVFFQEALAEAQGMALGAVDAFRFLAARIKGGSTPYEELLTRQSLPPKLAEQAKIERAHRVINGANIDNEILKQGIDFLGSAINIPGGALTTMDLFFKVIHYRAQVYKDATRSALSKGLRGSDLSDDIRRNIDDVLSTRPEGDVARAKAIADADFRTYTNRPEGKLNQWMAGKGQELGALRWIVPFRRTLVNLINYGIESTPAAPLMSSKVRTALQAGGPERAEAIARMSVGTMLTAATVASLGDLLDGDGPRNQQERDLWLKNGHKSNTLRLPGGKFVPLDSFGPLAPFLMAWGNYQQYLQNADLELDPDVELNMATLSAVYLSEVAQAVADMHWVANISEFLSAIQNFKNSEEASPKSIQIFLDKFITGLVPFSTIGKDIQKQVRKHAFDDPYSIDHNDWDAEPFSRTRHLSGIYSDKLSRKVSLWGDYMTFDNWLDPKYQDPVTGKDEVYEKMKAVGAHIPISRREKYGVKMTPREFETFLRLAGQGIPGRPPLRDAIVTMMNSKTYETYPGLQGELITSVIQSYRDAASAYMLKNVPEFQTRVRAKIEADKAKAQPVR